MTPPTDYELRPQASPPGPLAPVIARIVLRYMAAGMVAIGGWIGLSPEATDPAVTGFFADPDVIAATTAGIGALIGLVSEWFYARARRRGGPT